VRKPSSSSSKSSSSSSSSSDSSSSDSDSGSSGKDEAIAEDRVLDRSEEEQLRVLKKKETARKKEKREKRRKKEKKSVLKWAEVIGIYLRETPETEKEAEKSEAKQHEKEAETPEADLTETGRGEHSAEQSESEKDKKREVRCRTMKERLGSPVPPAAGETSAAAGGAHKLSRLAGYTIPRVVSPISKCYFESFESLPPTLEGCIIRCPETTQERLLFGILADAGMVLSGRRAERYRKPHFRIQKERTHRREDHRKTYSD